PAQPTRDRKTRSLEELVRVQFREIYLVHRLDTPTSGVMIFARTREAAAKLSKLLASGEIEKRYIAVIDGAVERETTIDSPIDGREAITIVRPLEGSRIEIQIKTGRTNQIRI